MQINIPILFRARANRRRIIPADETQKAEEDILLLIARGRRWQAYIDEGRFANIKSLAQHLGREPGRVASVLRLAMR